MKKTLSLILTLILLVSCCSFAFAEEQAWPTAAELLDDIVIGWNMGNTLDAYSSSKVYNGGLSSETCWSNPKISAELVKFVHDSGFNAIRLPTTWQNHITDPATMTIDEKWMDRVEEVVKIILDEGMYCILNIQHDTGSNGWLTADQNNYDEKAAKFANEWLQIATRFKDYGDHLVFEGFNEILNDKREWNSPDQQALDACNALNQLFVDTVRATGSNNARRVLVVTTYAAAANQLIRQGFVMPTDTVEDKLAVEVHIYAPFTFTHPDQPGTTWRATDVDPFITGLQKDFKDKGIPVLIGEFGCVDKDNRYARMTWAKHMVIMANKYDIPCMWWDNGGDFGIINRHSLTWSDPEMLTVITSQARDINWYVSQFAPGDANEDGQITPDDVTLLKDYLTNGGETVPYCDMNYDGTVDETDLALLKDMVKDMANMCSDTSKWSKWIDTAAGASGDVSITATGIIVNVKAGGANPWSFQPTYTGLTIEEGATYTLSFDYRVKADTDVTVPCFIMRNYGDYGQYATFSITATAEKQHFEATFTMEGATDSNARFSFDLGGAAVPAPYSLYITNVSLIRE